MSTTTTQYMSLVLPVPTTERGPEYAVEINSAMTLIDQHDHSSGKGTPITPTGLDINADLEFNGNDATELRSSRYEVQASPLATASDLGCAYVSGVDLYYNDVNGNQIRLTQSGSVAGTPGNITGLVAPASVSYTPVTFTFQSTTATAANIDAGSYTVREVLASAKGITLASPSGLAADYTLTMPSAVASATSFVTSDSSGNLSYTRPDNITTVISSSGLSVKPLGISQGLLAPKPIATSAILGQVGMAAISGQISINSIIPTYTTVASVTIPVTGNRPVYIGMIAGASSAAASLAAAGIQTGSGSIAWLQYFRNDVGLGGLRVSLTAGQTIPVSSFNTLDFPATSSYTYSIRGATTDGSGSTIGNATLTVFET